MPYLPISCSLHRYAARVVACLLLAHSAFAQPRGAAPRQLYTPSTTRQRVALTGLQTIENDKIRVGVDTRYGGALTYLAFKDSHNGQVRTENMVNNPDLGRQVQIALYSGPTDYSKNGAPAWTGLGWNPIQAGDTYNNPSEVVAIQKESNLLYVKTIPKQFGINNEPGEATIEHWLRLEGNVVKVHAKVVMFRSDKNQYEARQQEMPCAYLNGDYHNMWYYRGGRPFTNDNLDLVRPPTSFSDVLPTEPWMASTNDYGYGVGMYVPNNYDWKKGYFGSDLAGNEFSFDASYIGATNYLVLDHNLVHEWDYELIVGNLTEIRNYIYSRPRPLPGPNYRFDTSRKGWYYYKTQDTGWPINGKLHIILNDSRNNQIKSPFAFWKGRENPKIYLRAAFQTQHNRFRLNWRRAEDVTLYGTGDRYVDFPIINDGQFHTYEIDLSKNENWLSHNIGQLIFRPVFEGPSINGWAEFEWIATSAAGPIDQVVEPGPGDPVVEVPCEPGCAPVRSQRLRYVVGNRKG
ncbi:hypothetical protein [Spirosoma knui]